jgi:hypothetical protein
LISRDLRRVVTAQLSCPQFLQLASEVLHLYTVPWPSELGLYERTIQYIHIRVAVPLHVRSHVASANYYFGQRCMYVLYCIIHPEEWGHIPTNVPSAKKTKGRIR